MRQAFKKDKTDNQKLVGQTKQQTYKEIRTLANFSMREMEHEAYSVKDFDGNIWIKLGDGDYVLQRDPSTSRPLKRMYYSAKTVKNSQMKLIAKRLKEPNEGVTKMIKDYDNYRGSDYEMRRVNIHHRTTVETYDKTGHKITGESR